MGNIIEVKNLNRKFGNLIAVDNISFEVKEGEIFGFLGTNGAGKTTTITMLITLLRPTSGVASLEGFDIIKNAIQPSISPMDCFTATEVKSAPPLDMSPRDAEVKSIKPAKVNRNTDIKNTLSILRF